MENNLFPIQNENIEQKAEYINILKSQIALKIAFLQELLFNKAKFQAKCKQQKAQTDQLKQKQYNLLRDAVTQQCKKVEFTRKLENQAIQAALSVRQKYRISLKIDQCKLQQEKVRKQCQQTNQKEKILQQQLKKVKDKQAKTQGEKQAIIQKVFNYERCESAKFQANTKLKQAYHFYQQKIKELNDKNTLISAKLFAQNQQKTHLEKSIAQLQSKQYKKSYTYEKQEQESNNTKNSLQGEILRNEILNQKYQDTKSKMQQLISKNQCLLQNLQGLRQKKQQSKESKNQILRKWGELRLKVSIGIQYSQHFVQTLKSF